MLRVESASSRFRVVGAAATVVALLGLVLVAAAGDGDLNLATAALLGVVEGITEFLPVSSTGHLTVVERLLGIQGDAADAYVIVIQAGAISAVLVLYRQRFLAMVAGARGRDPTGRRLLGALIVAFLPAAVAGLVLGDTIKDNLFGVGPIAIAWAVGGVAILAASGRLRPNGIGLDAMSWRTGALVGAVQVVALWPGVSRSLVTIVAGVALGLSLAAAVEFGFLLGVVTLSAASVYEAAREGGAIVDAYGLVSPLVGFAVAWLSALVAVRWMVGYLQRRSLAIFGWYRLAVAAVAALLLAVGAV